MNTQPSNNFNMNAKYFSDRLDADIIQYTKAIAVEYSLSIEEAKLMARQMTQRKLNTILTDEEKNGIADIAKTTKDAITKHPKGEYPKAIYELLKTMELI